MATAPTTVVSARVDTATATLAAARIKDANLTVAEVIKRVWQQIAETGEMPVAPGQKDKSDALQRLSALQDRLAPMPDSFNAMSAEQLEDVLGDCDA